MSRNSTVQTSSGGGLGFTGALTILFIGLKLGHVIDWSWWWVLSPLWIGFAAGLVFFALGFLAVFLWNSAEDWRSERRRKRLEEEFRNRGLL